MGDLLEVRGQERFGTQYYFRLHVQDEHVDEQWELLIDTKSGYVEIRPYEGDRYGAVGQGRT